MAAHNGSGDDSPVRRRSVLKATGALGAAGLGGLAGCTGGGGDGDGDGGDGGDATTTSADTTQTTTASSSDSVTIGWLYPLTGPYGGLAEFQRQGSELAVQQLNADGGVNGAEVSIVSEDTQADPQTGNQRARKLVEDDGVDALMGCISSAVGSAVASYAEEQNVPFYPGVAADEITMDNCRRTTFRYETRASQTAAAAASWAVENFGTDLWVHNADYLWGNSVASAWKREARAADDGVTVHGETKSELGASDFSSYISQIASSDAGWVLTGVNGGDAVNFLKQAQSYGLKSSTTIVSPVNSFQFIRKAAGTAVQDTYSAIRYYEGYDSQANREFASAFADAYGNPPDNFANVAFTYVKTWASAAEQAGTVDADPVIDAQTAVEFDSPMGPTTYRECDHQAARPYNVGKVVAPGDYDWPSIEVQRTIPAEEATVPCEDTGCSF